MSEVTAKMVAELRASTGLGMMECKKALVEADGDFAKAEEILRIRSGAKAVKLAGRTAAEGIITSYIEGNRGVLVEVNCETDFVAKDESFKEFANDVAKAVVVNRPANLEQLSESQISVGQTVEGRRKEIIAKLGENMTIRRFEYYETENQLTSYIHGNRIGVIVEFQGDEPIARDVAMHIAALRPQYVSSDQVDEELIEKERHIHTEQAAESGKPKEIIAKIVDGRLKKFLAEITLLGQQFVKNPDQTVEQLLKENDSKVIDFAVYHVGEGLEKKVTDYAAEVAAAAKV